MTPHQLAHHGKGDMIPQVTLPGLGHSNTSFWKGERLRDAGIAKLERHEWMEDARLTAEAICLHRGTVSTDALHDIVSEPPHVNCFGAIFHDKRFKSTGRFIQSKRKESHARWIQVWELA